METPAFDRPLLAAWLQWLAEQGVYIGTSSWKYPGWLEKLYSRELYKHNKRFSQARFERECLREHAETFSTVCVDAGYYRFPPPEWIKGMMEQVPDHYRFTFKVTDDITAFKFPKLPRHGVKAGQPNAHFLDAELFKDAFLTPLHPYREKVGVLIFEFSRFHSGDFARGRDFVAALGDFLGKLPKGWKYGVEVRNHGFLQPEYFAMLKSHGVAHVFNAWTHMSTLREQMEIPGSQDTAPFCAARLLLKQGRTFEEAVQMFNPYDKVKEPREETRAAARDLITNSMQDGERLEKELYLYVNNRLEGCSLETIFAILLHLELIKTRTGLFMVKRQPGGKLL